MIYLQSGGSKIFPLIAILIWAIVAISIVSPLFRKKPCNNNNCDKRCDENSRSKNIVIAQKSGEKSDKSQNDDYYDNDTHVQKQYHKPLAKSTTIERNP
jgi:hypothetical protein